MNVLGTQESAKKEETHAERSYQATTPLITSALLVPYVLHIQHTRHALRVQHALLPPRVFRALRSAFRSCFGLMLAPNLYHMCKGLNNCVSFVCLCFCGCMCVCVLVRTRTHAKAYKIRSRIQWCLSNGLNAFYFPRTSV